jgi:hypothetical protein
MIRVKLMASLSTVGLVWVGAWLEFRLRLTKSVLLDQLHRKKQSFSGVSGGWPSICSVTTFVVRPTQIQPLLSDIKIDNFMFKSLTIHVMLNFLPNFSPWSFSSPLLPLSWVGAAVSLYLTLRLLTMGSQLNAINTLFAINLGFGAICIPAKVCQ